MDVASPLWPARFHHLVLSTEQPDVVADWYVTSCEMKREETSGLIRLSARDRTIFVERGSCSVRQFAYAVETEAQFSRLRDHIRSLGLAADSSVSTSDLADPLGLRDPDGNLVVFGLDQRPPALDSPRLLGRLQHIVFATTRLNVVVAFYSELLGFRISDIVRDDQGDATACFMRSNDEHHSLAFFRADKKRLDHISFESTCWTDIRDWGDHFASRRIPIVWGAGRHGAGNNLFIFVRDPMGTMVEVSAEIERIPYEAPPREWPHEERTLNLWGTAFLRS